MIGLLGRSWLRPSVFHVLAAVLAVGGGYVAAGGLSTDSGADTSGIIRRLPRATSPSATRSPVPSVVATPKTSTVAPSPVPSGFAVLLAARGDAVWRWTGPTSCPGPATGGRLTRSADGARTWDDVVLPAGVVVSLDAASTDRASATVLDEACAPSVVTSDDAGATWEVLDASGALTAVSLGAVDGRWALRDGIVVRDVDDAFVATSAAPCSGTDVGPPSLVQAVSANEAYVVCQSPDGSGRLLAGTRNGGQSWQRLAGKRTESGLAGTGRVAGVQFADRDNGVVLLRGAACPNGELRVTTNAGALWRALPCPVVEGSPSGEVLSVVVRADRSLYAVARAGSGVRGMSSADGQTWQYGGG